MTVGLIGGIAYSSSAVYYSRLNEIVASRRPGHSAKITMVSLDLHEYATLWAKGETDSVIELLVDAATKLKSVGVDFLAICSNTSHFAVPAIKQRVPKLAIVHIGDCIALRLGDAKKVGLLSTKFTAKSPHLIQHLSRKGFEIVLPSDDDQERLHEIIEKELSFNILHSESRSFYIDVCAKLQQTGATHIVLGCTEIGLLLKQSDLPPTGGCTLIDSLDAHVSVVGDILTDIESLDKFR